jgi:hypothetical protein
MSLRRSWVERTGAMRTSMRRHCLSSRRGGSRSWSSAAAGALRAMLLSALCVSSHSLFGDSVHRMRSVLSGYQGGAAIFRAVSPPRRGWTTRSRVALHFTIYAVAGYLLSLWPHGLASFSSELPGLRSGGHCAVARRPLRSPTNCVVAPQASSLRPPPPASLRTWHRGRLPSLRGAVDLSPSRTDLGCSERSLPEAYAKHLITFGCSLLPSMVGRSSFHIGPFRARRTVADPLRVLRTSGGRPSHLIFRELR